jgi:hypothetical protein
MSSSIGRNPAEGRGYARINSTASAREWALRARHRERRVKVRREEAKAAAARANGRKGGAASQASFDGETASAFERGSI